MPYFAYGDAEIAHLKRRDKRLARVIDEIGPIQRDIRPDLFEALVHSIVGQQISIRAQETIWARVEEGLGRVTPDAVLSLPPEELRRFGLSGRKVSYIQGAARRIVDGELDLPALSALPDDEVCRHLTQLAGVGVWTAEMLMLFSMQRPDILSFGDLGILRGMCKLYHHRDMPRERFERYRRRYSPYGSVASLYLWAISSAGEELAL